MRPSGADQSLNASAMRSDTIDRSFFFRAVLPVRRHKTAADSRAGSPLQRRADRCAGCEEKAGRVRGRLGPASCKRVAADAQ